MYRFTCGCEFPVVGNGLDFDIDNVTKDCPATWDLISRGDVVNCFQIETELARQWCQRVKPNNIASLADTIAIIRPGTLKALDKNKISLTEHYVLRRFKEEEIEYDHPSLADILSETMGILIYQEQSLAIVRKLAGFSLADAEVLRKGIGKKKADIVAKCRTQFIEGCKTVGIVTEEESNYIFDIIEKSNRYSFNKSHAYGYAEQSYASAYVKTHFRKQYSRDCLNYTKNLEEVSLIVDDCKSANIPVYIPDIYKSESSFSLKKEGIFWGLKYIKDVGEASVLNIKSVLADRKEWNWFQFLTEAAPKISISICKILAKSGALDSFKVSRNRMIFELDIMNKINDNELKWIHENNFDNLELALERARHRKKRKKDPEDGVYGATSTNGRYEKLTQLYELYKNPPYSLKDTPGGIALLERSVLGTAITCNETDDCDNSQVNCFCNELKQGRSGNELFLGVVVDRIKVIKTKKGKNPGQEMAFLTIRDDTGLYDSCVVFPEPYKKYKHLLVLGNTVLLLGDRKNNDSFIVKGCNQI